MTQEQQSLLNILSNSLFNHHNPVLESPLMEAQAQAVSGIVCAAMKDAPEQLLFMEASNSARIFYNHAVLHKWLSSSNIPYVILKGCASAYYYPDPTLRSMGDVDFLVPGDYLEAAGQILEAQGLKPWDENHIAHIVYRGAGMCYEMHFKVAGFPNGHAGELMEQYFSDVFDKAELKMVGDSQMMLPSPFHHGLVLLLHTVHHMTGEGIGLRHLCDWALFENSLSNDEFVEMYEDKLQAVGLWRFAQILTQVSIKYLGAEKREWAGEADELADQLMEDILSAGNFGVKDTGRSYQTMMISDRGKAGVGKTGMFSQFVESVNNVLYLKIPAAKKYKALLIPGWLFYGGRYGVRVLVGKRKNMLDKDIVEGAEKRRNLYKRLELYEA
jgi:hypothetical protein